MKKLWFVLCAVAMGCMLCFSALAERVGELPVMLAFSEPNGKTDGAGTFFISRFKVTDVKPLSQGVNRVSFNLGCRAMGYVPEVVLDCYDKDGMYIETAELDLEAGFADVSELCAMVEVRAKHNSIDSYLYCNYVNVYAEDGRVIGIHELLVPVYTRVGWHPAIEVCSEDGRTLEIDPFTLEAYRNVGWFTKADLLYKDFTEKYAQNREKGDELANLELVTSMLPDFYGTEYESMMYTARTEAITLWRQSAGTPVAFAGCVFDIREDAGYVLVKIANIDFRNVASIKVEFDVVDKDGNATGDKKEFYYATGADVAPGGTKVFIWKIDNMKEPVSLDNFAVKEVVFTDSAKWYDWFEK